jgi:hypothetical protein
MKPARDPTCHRTLGGQNGSPVRHTPAPEDLLSTRTIGLYRPVWWSAVMRSWSPRCHQIDSRAPNIVGIPTVDWPIGMHRRCLDGDGPNLEEAMRPITAMAC